MLTTTASLAGILLWAPGVGIPLYGGHMVSPYEVLIVLLLPAIILASLDWRRAFFAAIAVAICTLSYVYSLDRSVSQLYYLYYLAVMIPQMLLFLHIFSEGEATRAFFRSFVRTGICLAPLAFLQLVSPIEITLNNNMNYSLARGVHRAWLFTPEASILAGLYILAICLVLYNLMRKADPELPSGPATLTALFVGIAATLSTSFVVLLPPLALFVCVVSGVRWKKLLPALALGIPLIGLFLFFGYAQRYESGDVAGSVLLRLVSIIAGAQLVIPHWLTGVGIGMNRDAVRAIEILSLEWGGQASAKPGFDSFQLSMVAEMGVIPGLLSLAALIVCLRVLWRRRTLPAGGGDLVAVFAVVVWCVALATGGYRGLAHFWLYFPAAYAFFLRDGCARAAWTASIFGRRRQTPAQLAENPS